MKLTVITFILLFSVTNISGQEFSGKTKYAPGFKFKDGIYPGMDNVKANNPIPKSSLLIADDFNDPDFFKKILASNAISYFDGEGNKHVIEKNNIWGFASGGTLRVLFKGYFNSLEMMGTISCFFVEDQKYEIFNTLRSGKISDQTLFTPEDVPAKHINRGSNISSFRELDLYLLDFRTGDIHNCNIRNLKTLLESEPGLYNEYKGLPQNLKKALMFYYIRKFNEKNPLYLPVK